MKTMEETPPSTTMAVTTKDDEISSSEPSHNELGSSLTWSLGDDTVASEVAPVAELKTGKTIKSRMRPAPPLSVALFTSSDRGREHTSRKLHTMTAPSASVAQGAYESLFNR